MRNVQHKKEAYVFYSFLSNFYDNFVNPLFWNKSMRDTSLSIAKLDEPGIKVVDVGSGTGFTTQGIVKYVSPEQVDSLDQSPHQMRFAKKKADLQGVTFHLGDAEDLPFETDTFDRYVSAGSIEYWPEPERGIAESYRVLKPGGLALMIGPIRPDNRFTRWLADTWMLFPEEEEYLRWYREAGFVNLRKVYVAPPWILRERFGIALVGEKPVAGESPMELAPLKAETRDRKLSGNERLLMLRRIGVGFLAGFAMIPLALYGYIRLGLRRLFGRGRKADIWNQPETVSAR